MANPFDQFDAPTSAANPFDQFDAPLTAPAENLMGGNRVRDLTEEQRALQRAGYRARLAGVGEQGPGVVGEGQGFSAPGPEGGLGQQLKGIAQGMPFSLYSGVAGLTGDMLPSGTEAANYFLGPAANPAVASGRESGMIIGIPGGAEGAVVGRALSPVGKAIGTVMQPVNNLVGRGVTAASNMLNPYVRQLMPSLEGRGAEYAATLRNPELQVVPGSVPTAGEALAGAGVSGTQFPALQAELATKFAPTQFAERAAANEAAQVKSLGTIAQTPADLYAAETARSANAGVNYKKAMTTMVPADETLANLLETPAMKSAVKIAEELAANKQRAFQVGENVPAHTVASSILDAEGKPVMRQIAAETAQYPGQSLHEIKLALDTMMETKSANGTPLGPTQLANVKAVRDQFLNWFEKKVPDYKSARQAFAEESKPINVMEVGQALKKSLTSPLNETTTRPGVFAQAVENAPGTIKKATGNARFEDLSGILEAGDSLKVSNILQDLARTDQYKKLAQAGAAQNRATGPGGVTAIPGFTSFIASTANKIMSALEGRVNRGAAIEIAQSLLHPETAANMIEKTMAAAAANKARPGAIAAKIGAGNVLATNALRGTLPTLNALNNQ